MRPMTRAASCREAGLPRPRNRGWYRAARDDGSAAGAAEVVTCEINPAIAERAKIIIAQNGYEDRVRVVPDIPTRLKSGST